MGTFLDWDDLTPFATGLEQSKALTMIEDAEALALLAAPCIGSESFANDANKTAALKAILRGAIVRWAEAGSGAVQAQNAGPFGYTVDTRQERRSMFWPSEIAQIRSLCIAADSVAGSAYSIDTTPGGFTIAHLDVCSVNFGALYCTCGAILLAGVLP